MEDGAGKAHRWTVGEPKAPPLPSAIEDGDQLLTTPVQMGKYYARMWEQIWGQDRDQWHRVTDAIRSIKEMGVGDLVMIIFITRGDF